MFFPRRLALKPWHLGAAAAVFLFLLYIPRWLVFLSPMHGSFAFDYFTLPRCGLAVRNATNLYTSSADYSFGYFATNWASHPVLCVVLGVPFSFISPWVGFWLNNVLYLLIHLFLIWALGRRLKPDGAGRFQTSQYLAMAALGLFFPWYMNYHLGQYHLIFVLALGLALLDKQTWGFSLSALGKPALAPAALCLLVARKWGVIAKVAAVCAVGYLPFLLLHFDAEGHLRLGLNESFLGFFKISSLYSHYSVRGWDQEMGWSKVLDEMFLWDHYPIRLVMTAGFSLWGAVMARKNLAMGIAFSSLWFFFSYGRIHEYHYATLVPVLAWALSERGFSPRAVALGACLLALPTVWPLLQASSAHVAGKGLRFSLARSDHPLLFWTWLLHRPLTVLYIAGLIVVAWVRQERREVL